MPSAFPQNYYQQPSPPEFLANPAGFPVNAKAHGYENGDGYALPPPYMILPPPSQAYQRNSFNGLPPPGISHPSKNFNQYNAGRRASMMDLPPLVEDKPAHHRVEVPQAAARQQPQQQEKPSGGVSAQLDYEIKEMAEFVATASLNIAFPKESVNTAWRNFVTQILTSTRLPDATILLALNYLSKRVNNRKDGLPPHLTIHKLLTIALLLASKFLDDNTFQNKSWAEVTNIPVAEINTLEAEWLKELNWCLHIDPTGQKSWQTWKDAWTRWKKEQDAAKAQASPVTLAPIDTKFDSYQSSVAYGYNRQRSMSTVTNNMFTVASSRPQSGYWSSFPSPIDSPPSAPETGPSTPEYNGWPQFTLPPPQYQSRYVGQGFNPYTTSYITSPFYPKYEHQDYFAYVQCRENSYPVAHRMVNQAVVG